MKAIQIQNTFTDAMVDSVARVSFDKMEGVRKPEAIHRLNTFLVRELHWSPIGHPMATIVAHQDVLPLKQLASNKFLMAGLNLHYENGAVYITAGAWGFLQLAKFLQSSELLDMVGLRLPYVTEAFIEHHKPKVHTTAKRLFRFTQKTPHNHQWATFVIEAPIPIRTQDFKHKQGFIDNESSRRYVDFEPEIHAVKEWRSKPKNAKQGSGDRMYLSGFNEALVSLSDWFSVATYNRLIRLGVAPEQARFKLPQGMMTKYVRTGTREAFDNYFSLRCKPDAQLEIQQLATMIRDTIKYQGA